MFAEFAFPIFEQSIKTYHIVDDVYQPVVNPFEKGTIEYSKLKLKFIEMVILSTERLESALNKVSYTSNLWNWDHWQDTKIKITLY